jgi:hypothetical protein
MRTPLILALLLAGTALEAAAQPTATRRPPVVRQRTDAPSPQRPDAPRRAQPGAAATQSALTARQRVEIVEAAGLRGVVLAAPFRLSPDAPVAPGGRGILSVVHGAVVTPRSLAGDPGYVAAYNRLGGDGVSNVRLAIATRAGAHYLFECQAQKRGVQMFLDGEPGEHFFGDAPITFVLQATRTGAATIAFAGDGSPPAGEWYFFGCDVTPTAQ